MANQLVICLPLPRSLQGRQGRVRALSGAAVLYSEKSQQYEPRPC